MKRNYHLLTYNPWTWKPIKPETAEEKADRKERGILFGSGLIAGEGIIGVLVAGYAFVLGKPGGLNIGLPDWLGQVISLSVFVLLSAFLIHRAVKKTSVG